MRRMTRSALTTLSLLATLATGVAHAQTTPRVLVIFDTSGSMLWDYEDTSDCRGDGSVEFPHRTCALGSKMFFAKQALSQIVRDSDDVEFGLPAAGPRGGQRARAPRRPRPWVGA